MSLTGKCCFDFCHFLNLSRKKQPFYLFIWKWMQFCHLSFPSTNKIAKKMLDFYNHNKIANKIAEKSETKPQQEVSRVLIESSIELDLWAFTFISLCWGKGTKICKKKIVQKIWHHGAVKSAAAKTTRYYFIGQSSVKITLRNFTLYFVSRCICFRYTVAGHPLQ